MSQTIERPASLTSGDFLGAEEPFGLLAAWLEEAARSEPVDPNAMAVATVDTQGLPNARMVLLKDFDHRGLVFYTNTDSQKGRELDVVPKAALVFYWKSLGRQVRIRGPVERVEEAEADAYFATRPRLATRSRRRWRSTPPSMRWAPFPARRTGRDIASSRS